MPTDDISELIRLALTPVFLITAVSSLLGVLTARVARVADQAIAMKAAFDPGLAIDELAARVRATAARGWLLLAGMAFSVVSALLITAVIVLLYITRGASADVSRNVGLLFVLSIAALAIAMLCLLFEVGVASSLALKTARDLNRLLKPIQ